MKKNYIAPAVEIEQLDMADGILVGISNTEANNAKVMETKDQSSGNWSDIWDE